MLVVPDAAIIVDVHVAVPLEIVKLGRMSLMFAHAGIIPIKPPVGAVAESCDGRTPNARTNANKTHKLFLFILILFTSPRYNSADSQ
jgi:hypothetical protein